MKIPWARIERLMNVGSLTWEQAAAALGCTTAAMAQWKTGKTGLSSKSLYNLEQKEKALGIADDVQAMKEEQGSYTTRINVVEVLQDLYDMKIELTGIAKRVDAAIKRLEGK